ncbi:Putative arsenical resistance operon repressor ArsR [Nocardia seriolae]|uniref:ArsR family transcriptional regulator n=1 Tax=Nocardia seriolae TaxID=37332 RepID=A0ABC9YQN4_9NOCA|nr:Putative arsenical resistance operon repressor ArsR [Nocardia seriolae]GEM23348.1 transcriptional regulator [Nocardia seriolae NBRC 15557]BEK86697.1 metalloregulator ArsR/SmtB family transcription factor [Nocardia seriolae]BEK94452.1 metalloregulator ArsR/SmtB family transcription factor [Nocardia seriolae]GAM45671.1 ArsR family transcriptional regulator [Nocardia seriolae]
MIAAADCCVPLSARLAPEAATALAASFKALGDPVRLRLLSLIAAADGEEVCVCELTPVFDLSQPTISHHLKVLREAGLLTSQRRGTWVYYRLVPAALQRLSDTLDPTGRIPTPA